MTDKERQALRDIHVDLTRNCTERDLDAYYEANRRFHEAIYAGSHNPYLEDMARSLFIRLTPYRRYQLNRPERIEESCAEHGAIIEAIAASDTELAQQLMRKHVSIQAEVLGEFVSVMAH
jgi:DNA-binding GntR family transcriptional regulator